MAPPNIKIQHKRAKQWRAPRRRVDWACGCLTLIQLNYSHGFMHRGISNCVSFPQWCLYLGPPKSLVHQDNGGRRDIPRVDEGGINNRVQPKRSESVESSLVLDLFEGWDDIDTFDLWMD
ncbi:Geminivirus AL2 coat protein, MSV type [Sesbania bispinosa]|nr:Geminivirus AL2 coat protein, MSV type [Sesbania bispinosa]